jgi:hypothetical protein
MLTSDYVTAYIALNHKRLRLVPCTIEPATNRTPPGLDPLFPEVIEGTEGEINLRDLLADRFAL